MDRTNRDALGKLLDWEYDILRYEFDRGGVTNFVVCFCEEGDVPYTPFDRQIERVV